MAMGTCKNRQRQESLWVDAFRTDHFTRHPFYQRLNELLDQQTLDEFAEQQCASFSADRNGRPALTPGIYFRCRLIGYFDAINSERGIA